MDFKVHLGWLKSSYLGISEDFCQPWKRTSINNKIIFVCYVEDLPKCVRTYLYIISRVSSSSSSSSRSRSSNSSSSSSISSSFIIIVYQISISSFPLFLIHFIFETVIKFELYQKFDKPNALEMYVIYLENNIYQRSLSVKDLTFRIRRGF